MSYYKNESTLDSKNYSSFGRAWCDKCYGFFNFSPTSAECQEHIFRDCNKIGCSKTYNSCVRKFANFEEEINHIICLSRNDVEDFDEDLKIQNRIKSNDYPNQNLSENTSIFFQQNKDDLNPWEIKKENTLSKSVRKEDLKSKEDSMISYENDFIKSKVDSIFSINPGDVTTIKTANNKKDFISQSHPEINKNLNLDNKYRNASVKLDSITKNTDFFLINETIILNDLEKDKNTKFNNSNKPQQFKLDDSTLSMLKSFNKMNLESCKTNRNLIDIAEKNKIEDIKKSFINKNFSSVNNNNYIIQDQLSIEDIFEIIHDETKIYKKAFKKLKLEFKKRGWTNAKILRLLNEKYKNWEFLYDIEIKTICSQSEAICLFLENILKRIN